MINYGDIDYGITVFAAEGPRRKPAGRAGGGTPAGPSSPPRRLVLLVDDSPAVAEALGAVLGNMGLERVVASNGRGALEVYRERGEAIGLVMLDMNMPEMSGEETLKALREIDPEVKVLIATTADEAEVRRRCDEQGEAVPHYLRKTDGVEAIVAKVRTVLEEGNNV